MLLILRKVLFYFFLILYFLFTPYVILYALGYNFNPAEVELVKTGLVSVVTIPRSATIYIQGKKYSEKTPAAIRDLLPGRYSVRVLQKGYEPWEKEVVIEPEKATRLDPILLLPKLPDQEVVSARNYTSFVPHLVDSKLIAWEGKTLDKLWRTDLFFKKDTPVGLAIPGAEETEIKNVQFKRNSELALFEIKRNGNRGYLAFDLNGEKDAAVDLTGMIPEDPEWISWDTKNPDGLYFLREGKLSWIDLKRRVLHPDSNFDVLGFGVKQNKLYLLKKDFAIVSVNSRDSVEEPFSDDTGLSRKIFGTVPARYFRIEFLKKDLLQRDLLIFLSDHGTLITNRLPYHLVNQDVLGVEYATHSEDEKLLYWTEREIGMIDFTHGSGNLFEEGPHRSLIHSQGQNIRQAFWVYDDSHILFLDGNEMFLIEAKGPTPHLLHSLGFVKQDTPILYHERSRALYFLHPESGRLMKRKIAD